MPAAILAAEQYADPQQAYAVQTTTWNPMYGVVEEPRDPTASIAMAAGITAGLGLAARGIALGVRSYRKNKSLKNENQENEPSQTFGESEIIEDENEFINR